LAQLPLFGSWLLSIRWRVDASEAEVTKKSASLRKQFERVKDELAQKLTR
jgi:hypothetical protein